MQLHVYPIWEGFPRSKSTSTIRNALISGLGLYVSAKVVNPTHLVLASRDRETHADALVRALVSAGVAIREVIVGTPSLEETFFALVQQARSTA